MGGLAAPALITPSFAQAAAPPLPRGNYLIKNGAVITVDAGGVVQRADVHVNNGRIEAVRPRPQRCRRRDHRLHRHDRHAGLYRHALPHVERPRPQLRGRRLRLPRPRTRPRSSTLRRTSTRASCSAWELANAGITTVRNWSHNTRTRARRRRIARPSRVDAARPLRLRPHRSDAAQRAGQLRGRRSRQAAVFRPPARRSRGWSTSG